MRVWALLLASYFILAGCASVKPLEVDQLSRLKSGKTGVLALDSTKKLIYNNQTFYGVGIANTANTATYEGFFDSEKYISEAFSKRLNERGLQSVVLSLPASLRTPELMKRYSVGKKVMGGEPSDIETKRVLPADWKNFLAQSGYDYLFMSEISGLNVTTSNFDTTKAFVGTIADIYLYDVKSGALMWSATLSGAIPGAAVTMKSSPKEVENNDFALTKEAVSKNVDLFFVVDAPIQKGIDVGMGLRSKN